MQPSYTPLFFHSNYGQGGSRFSTFFEYLKKHNIQSCGIIDENFFGLAEFLEYARVYDIHPIIGTKIALPTSPIKSSYIYLFIKNAQGYINLCQIITKRAFGELCVDHLKQHADGIVFISDSLILLEMFKNAFTDMYYLLLPFRSVITRHFPLIAAHDIYYVTHSDRIIYKLMCAIKGNKCKCARGTPEHLLTPKEFARVYSDYPEAVSNNQKMAHLCAFAPSNQGWVFPQSNDDLARILKPRIHNLTPLERRRIDHEYRIIRETGFEPYFCLVHALKEFARARGIGINVRGSAASSLILHVLGLSVAHPLRYNLPFERFLNPQRTEPPDIDVDVEFNQRDTLVKEIFNKFGSAHVAHVSIVNRFRRRARFRDTARAYGISPQEIGTIQRHIGERLITDIQVLSERITGYPRHVSCHASGIVITPKPITTYVPLSPGPAGQITHFDKDGVENVGLVKIDILGVRGFPALYLSKDSVNFNDPRVYDLIGKANTLGCFMIESPLVRYFLKRIQPKTLMDIANAIAIIRPGPARGGMKERFLKRLKGEERITYPHARLVKALRDTLGIPVYQEQILQIAHDFAGFTLSHGDMLRRAMTKERNIDRMKDIEKIFFSKAQSLGYTQQEIIDVWERIKSFSSFGFNKAHAITYGTLAYLSAFHKLYEPHDFFCRVINNKGGYYTTYAYINEARRRGMKIMPPDVTKSDHGFTVQKKMLVTGLNEIANLSHATIQRIVVRRPFTDAEDFFRRVQPAIDEGIALIRSGALDVFQVPRTELYFTLLVARSVPATPLCIHDPKPAFTDLAQSAKYHDQFTTLNFLPDHHILEVFCPDRMARIAQLQRGNTISITGTPIVRTVIRTKNKKIMSFVTMDDETGVLDVVIFPNAYRPYITGTIMKCSGRINDETLIAQQYTCRDINY
jgi:DNA-directed DNA polymerase III PolC